ncbi:hypothetical protein TIFTF001_039717 [Ficus carica]|uniref:Uncharacterized protein n=1 Tax=Ficus carica TaxID=3494 RepID=A0AA88CUR8_FICCA|nr:hypothetical protein TIFTF001_039713 [Ficus carica]GMN19074.1 hypothetical protein TIFTF001_039717 [Ficus carica]
MIEIPFLRLVCGIKSEAFNATIYIFGISDRHVLVIFATVSVLYNIVILNITTSTPSGARDSGSGSAGYF